MSTNGPPRRTWARDRLPLLTSLLSALALLSVLPSALNIPQSTPSETLEYAPVPPEDQDDITPPSGNFSSLGLGSSSGLADDTTGAGDLAGGGEVLGGRSIKSPSTKRCVGDPPRQTEDPLSPPCVASYSGDNGGATYQGVTRDEIRVVFAVGGGRACDGCSNNPPEQQPTNRYYDLSKPPDGDPMDEHLYVRELRAWQRYFNDRFQTYGRFVNFFVHYGVGSGSQTAESSRAQAIQNYRDVDPFAAVAFRNIDGEAYTEVMASKGVIMFSDSSLAPAGTFARYPGLLWNYSASLELRADQYVSYVCTKVVPHPVADSGNVGENGQPRQLGIIYNSTEDDTSYIRFRTLIRQGIEKCGGKFVAEGTFPCDCFISTDPSYAPPVMADFREKGVTTVIWAGGHEPNFSRAAKAIGYFPEWVIAATDVAAGNLNGQSQDPDVWDHAWAVTAYPLVDQSGVTQSCANAYAEAGGRDDPLERNNSCNSFYETLRQMFTGIQVAGPKLNVQNLDKGYHAIPANDSARPDLPACFYGPGDYTCVKDNTVIWWDSRASSSTGSGCWRMSENGRRFRLGAWPEGNIDAQRRPDNICNNHLGGGS